jgi:hypothetical protein
VSSPAWLDATPPPNALWAFQPSGNSGEWSQISIDASSNFSSLSRITAGSYAYGNGLGFALGGTESYATYHYDYDDVHDFSLVPGKLSLPGAPCPQITADSQLGLVINNFTSREWFNLSSSSYSYYGLANNGMAHFVPSFGPNGLFMTFGGSSTTDQQLVPMDTVSMFDPWTQQWREQATTGDMPGETENACVVGVEGDDGTYEVQTSFKNEDLTS